MARTNGAAQSYSVTSAGVNPVEDRAHRMRMYFVAMTLRVACVGSLFWVRGWWIALPVLGSIILPWFAVMVGNAVAHSGEQRLDTMAPLELAAAESAPLEGEDSSATLLVVDVEPLRRSAAGGEEPAGDEAGAEP